MNNCIHCDKTLSSKYALRRHQLSCQALKLHIQQSQDQQHEKEIQTLKEQHEKEIQTLKEQHEKEILSAKKHIEKLESQIFEIAKQPKTVNNTTQTHNNRNTNIVNQLAIYDLSQDQITQLLSQYYNLNIFHGGPEEIAKLAAQFLLTDPDSQKLKVTCTDINRKNFKYVDEEQEVQVDPGFQKTHDIIKGPLSQANIRVYVDELKCDDKYHDQWKRNDDFISDRSGFSDKLLKFIA